MTQNMVRRIVEPDPGHTGARKKEIMNMANTTRSNPARPLLAWRVIDIIIAAVFAVAIGLIFWVWNSVGYAWYTAANAVTPGLGGIATGMWLLGGVVGGLVIRKPGAAIFVEVVAACVSAGIGNQWGIETVYSGLAQGLGAELIFAVFVYRKFGLVTSVRRGGVRAGTVYLRQRRKGHGIQHHVPGFPTGVRRGFSWWGGVFPSDFPGPHRGAGPVCGRPGTTRRGGRLTRVELGVR